jgi:hypothetical protein
MLWERVGELADRAPRLSDLRHHKLHLLAASRMRARGEEVPAELVEEERRLAAVSISASMLLRRIRAVSDAPIIVMKGPEAAARWPQARLRPWKDLDLLVADAHGLQRELLAAGFVEIGDPALYEDIHHLRPLMAPELPLTIEIHLRPKWPEGARTPTFEELFAAAAPGVFAGIPDVLAPSAAHHAVLLAGHAWEHNPLNCVGQLADVAALTLEAGHDAADAVAREWGVERLWATTTRAIDDLLAERRAPVWRRHLVEARERTVFEGHVERLVGPIAAGSPATATRALANTLRPAPGETWVTKVRRSGRALRNASLRRSDHLEERTTP